MKLNDKSRHDDLINAWERLVERNPEDNGYLFGLEKARNVQPETRREFWMDLAKKYPKSNAIKLIPLEFLQGNCNPFPLFDMLGDEFRIAVDLYLRACLSKGVPSTFVSLKSVYDNAEKRQILQDLAEGYLKSLKATATFPPSNETQPNGTATKSEPPTTLLWTLYFLSLHYAHPKSKRELAKSFQYIDEAINHTPTLVELYLTKARLLKYKGDLSGAVDVVMAARDLDMQDRFVNTKVGKYLLRNNRNDEALQILKDFTRVSRP